MIGEGKRAKAIPEPVTVDLAIGQKVKFYVIVKEGDYNQRTRVEYQQEQYWTVLQRYRKFYLMVNEYGIRQCFFHSDIIELMRKKKRVEGKTRSGYPTWE